jgi:hypothetical protein
VPCGILRLYSAESSDPWQLNIVIQDSLTGACIELETTEAPVEIEGDVELSTFHLEGDCHQEITL